MKYFYLFVMLSFLWSCKQDSEPIIIEFDNPGSTLGSEPNLHLTKNGTIYLSWIEAKKGEASKLLISTLDESKLQWSKPNLIAQGSDWFVNWADFPSITSFGENSLAAHYLDKSADDTYAYDVKLTISNDSGKTWDKAFIPHTDKTNTEHGFVSKVAIGNNKLLATWLDGRKYAYAEKDSSVTKEMTLRSAILDQKGTLIKEYELDKRVCDCCQTDSAITQNGPIVVFRDRSNTEIRDISYTRLLDGQWTEPKTIHNDNWSIFGCPVNGPAISTIQNNVAVSWYTSANEQPKVNVAFSNNNGNTFLKPISVDYSTPLGRVDIELLADGSAIVCWLDTINDQAVIQLQRVLSNGEKGKLLTVSQSSESRSSGFPRMILKDAIAYIAWTNDADILSVKTTKINLDIYKVKS